MNAFTLKRRRTVARKWQAGLGKTLGLMLTTGFLVACDGLLEVDLPDSVTDIALEDPAAAVAQVNGIIGQIECGLSSFSYQAAGYEDTNRRMAGVAGSYSEYNPEPGGGNCDGSAEDYDWYDPMQIGRASAFGTYERLENWTDAEIPGSRQQLLAKTALYAAIALENFGTFFCDMALEAGPIMTPDQILGEALTWLGRAEGDVAAAGGNFEMENGITGPDDADGITTMIRALRARINWADGNMGAVAADANLVPLDFTAWVTRESSTIRRNKVHFYGNPGFGQFNGVIDGAIWSNPPPGGLGYFTGSVWTPGGEWPAIIPFTGYLDLGIEDVGGAMPGRAVNSTGNALTTADANTVADTRIVMKMSLCNGCTVAVPVPTKFTDLADNTPLVSGRELSLIMAEIEGGQLAIDRVNALRVIAGLPVIAGAYQALLLGSADEMENMIIEERRRELFLEGRFWATKIRNTDKLWFPRLTGEWPEFSYALRGGVRINMPEDEYDLNGNFGREDRNSGCSAARYAGQVPIITG